MNLFENSKVGDNFINKRGDVVTYYGDECDGVHIVSDYYVLDDGSIFNPFGDSRLYDEYSVIKKV